MSAQRVRDETEFGPSAEAAGVIAAAVLERGLPKFTLLNINVPRGPNKGFKATVQAKRNHITVVSERVDPRHKPYYWIEEGENKWEPHDRSDYQAVRDGYVSITPLQPDMTAYDALKYVESLPHVAPPKPGEHQPGCAMCDASSRGVNWACAAAGPAAGRRSDGGSRPSRPSPCPSGSPCWQAGFVDVGLPDGRGADGGQREQLLEILAAAGWARGNVARAHEHFECVAAGAALVFEDRHGARL